jgi:hypothetical protein
LRSAKAEVNPVGLIADAGFGADVGEGAAAGRVELRKFRDAG